NFNKGTVDFLIGTHKILNDQLKPKDLGLLVIDEEQRFGVAHKEKIKKYKTNIDVLTLTATPIPRTLQMSLVGIRSLSLILTPPINRYPIQTYVVEEDKMLMKDAIYKELARNGQIFILYNHVDLIEHKAYEIQSLVPEARIIVTHGQMDKNKIEDCMFKFINHEADILLCTTIIETGIDIPNVNTLIILEADHFGLSQLYQIRGRVGRSDKIAYAYMMYKSGKVLGENAVKRLKAIEEFTSLGSGFKIANRDLSIRGAGDILGSEQAGFIDSVGVDLYLKILNEEVEKLKGTYKEEKDEDPNKALINVTTHIDDNYVYENEIKIEIHRLINTIDSYDKLMEVRRELEDRFGKINKDIEIYMYEEWFEKIAKDLDIIKVNQTKTTVEIIFSANKSNEIDGEKLFMNAYDISRYFKFNYKNRCLSITLEVVRLEKHYIYYLIELLKSVL
ncbi:MAG: transcription-repair coupling factor, partial [Bacilli bacterium]|nr:transcription-repair coupling factor [Bacilli bacterium]